MNTEIHPCVSTSGAVRTFETDSDARRFALREGDQSRLWTVEPVSTFKTVAIQAAYAADDAYEAALRVSNRNRWTAPMCGACDDDVEAAYAVKVRADKIIGLAFAIDRGQRAPFDIADLLCVDDGHAVDVLVISQAFLTNVEVLNSLTGIQLTCAEWEIAFGGAVACGQGAIPADIWSRVRAVRRMAEAARTCLA